MSLNTTPRTWVASAVLSAAQLNTEVRDAFTGVQAAWTSYTPALTNITVGNGTRTFKYLQIGSTIHVRGRFAAGGTTSYSAGNLGFALPVACHADYTSANNDWSVGVGLVQPGGQRMGVTAIITTAGILNFITDNLSTAAIVTNTVPAAFGTASVISLTVEYEAA